MKEIIEHLRKSIPEQIARDLISVQPMEEAGKALHEIYENSLSREELIAQGYEPVSHLGLMWTKKD